MCMNETWNISSFIYSVNLAVFLADTDWNWNRGLSHNGNGLYCIRQVQWLPQSHYELSVDRVERAPLAACASTVCGEAVSVAGDKSLLNCISKLLSQQGGQLPGLTSNNGNTVCWRSTQSETNAKRDRSENETCFFPKWNISYLMSFVLGAPFGGLTTVSQLLHNQRER